MAYDLSNRTRARDLYVAGRSLTWLVERLGISRATLQRWSGEDDWPGIRERNRQLEREAAQLVVSLTQAARESADPQQAYAAATMARLAGLDSPRDPNPDPMRVAERLLVVLMREPALAPLIQARRKTILADLRAELRRAEIEEPV